MTTHPFHYDSVCLNGLGCDLAVPPGDRSMADFISLDTNPADGRIYVTWDRANKVPDEAVGHVASPMVSDPDRWARLRRRHDQPGRERHQVLRSSSNDPTGDALSSYSAMTPGVVPPESTDDERAGGGLHVRLGRPRDRSHRRSDDPERRRDRDDAGERPLDRLADGERYTDAVAVAALAAALHERLSGRGGGGPLERRAGLQLRLQRLHAPAPSCASRRDRRTRTSASCTRATSRSRAMSDQATGTIRFSIPRFLLRALSGPTGPGQRPLEVAATAGSRFYDGTAFSLGNTVSPDQIAAVVPLSVRQHAVDGLRAADSPAAAAFVGPVQDHGRWNAREHRAGSSA